MNKKETIIAACALLIVCTIAAGENEPVNGEWVIRFAVQNQVVPGKMNLDLSGDKVSGTIYTDHTGPGTIQDGRWMNAKLTATLVFEKHESIALQGEWKEGGKLAGEFRTEGNVGKWEAQRAPSSTENQPGR